MKVIFKILLIIGIGYLITSLFYMLVVPLIKIPTSALYQIVLYRTIGFLTYILVAILMWSILLKAKDNLSRFPINLQYKKLLVLCIVFILAGYIYSAYSKYSSYLESQSLDKNSHYYSNNVYENSKYHFKLIYPEGSVFSSANPDQGFVTRFFLPDREVIKGDEENIGIYISPNNQDLEAYIQRKIKTYSEYGKVDTKDVNFAGQKGYRILYTSGYTSPKGTQELDYVTIKNGNIYILNYFPVTKNIDIVDQVAKSFEITQ